MSIAAGTALQLGPLIQQQVDANAAMAAQLISIQADGANTTPILIGMDKNVGSGSPVKYGFGLASGQDRSYSGAAANPISIGRFYVFSNANAVLHVEIFP